jgi:conjugative transfer signal peptidase TraF
VSDTYNNKSATFLPAIIVATALFLIISTQLASNFRVTISASLPRGFWRVDSIAQPLHYDEIVTFCPPENAVIAIAKTREYVGPGRCPAGIETQMKPVVALPGDTVEVEADGIRVNDILLPNSAPLEWDGQRRKAPAVAFSKEVVPYGFVWLVSTYNPWSFDSRYYGKVPTSTIRQSVRPLLIEAAQNVH